jgi:TRAP-type C4-dicarboxylate transport system permease small subunit
MTTALLWAKRIFACFVLGLVTWALLAIPLSFWIPSEQFDRWLGVSVYAAGVVFGVLWFPFVKRRLR